MNHLIAGYGEIGQAVYEVLEAQEGVTIAVRDPEVRNDVLEQVEVLHVCFPYSDIFVGEVNRYIDEFNPGHVIIWSTVMIGSTKKIPYAVHSPVEGRHPSLAESIRRMPRWIGYNILEEGIFFRNLFRDLGLKTKAVGNSDFTEFLKLRSTSKYGINIAWTNYEKKVADVLKMPFALLKDFDEDYNELYRDLKMDWAQRYILDPSDGPIGGHCVVPNAELLNEQFPSDLLIEIMETE